MKKSNRDIVEEAVSDAKALREAAMSAAKNEVIEMMAPGLRAIVERSISAIQEDKPNDQNIGYLGASGRAEKNAKFQEAKGEDMKKGEELDMESIANFFPPMTEEPEADEEAKDEAAVSAIPVLGEEPETDDEPKMEGKKKKDDEEEDMSESIEISESELKKVYDLALKTEAQVKKGFSDMTPSGELEDVVKDIGKGANPEKKGEAGWEEAEPPAKQDFTVKEQAEKALKKLIARGIQENKAIREENEKLKETIEQLASKLNESNLFAMKVLHVNRLLTKHGRLTKEQRDVVLESIDSAKTVDQVRMVYEAITKSFRAAGTLTESRAVGNAQRARTTGSAEKTVLRESADRENDAATQRMLMLAGIVS